METRVEVLARTCIGNKFKGQSPASIDDLHRQFIAHVSTLCGIGYKWYGDPKQNRSTRGRVLGKMHQFMLSHYGFSINEPRLTPWLRLFTEEPEGSNFDADDLCQGWVQMSEGESYREDYKLASDLITGYRVVFRTNSGFLGVGPVDIKVGDEVWVLAGAPTLAVLRKASSNRKSDGTFHREYLGPAYVHGLMHGEILDQGVQPEDITLV